MSRKQKILKAIVLLIVLVVFIYLVIELFPLFKELATEEGRNNFKETINSLGVKGVFVLIWIMCIQILVPILPGEPVEILAGMCFGPIKGMIYVLIGSFISSVFIITLVKIFGKKFIYTFVKKEKIEKLENSKFFKNTKKIDIIIFISFFIPGLPKDILIFIAALLPINTYRFLIISTFARIPSIISSTIAGSGLLGGNLMLSIGGYVITFAIVGILIYIVSRKDKNILKVVEEVR